MQHVAEVTLNTETEQRRYVRHDLGCENGVVPVRDYIACNALYARHSGITRCACDSFHGGGEN